MRDIVLRGRYFGHAAPEGAAALAGFLAGRSPADALRAWFGEESLRLFAGLRGTGGDGGPEAVWRDAVACIEEAVDRDIAAIDAMLAAQLDRVLHHQAMRRLEGRWRGLSWLVEQVPPAARIRVRLLDLRWGELCRDLARAVEFDQSNLFRKIYEDEFGIAGGEPFGLLCADYEVRHGPMEGYPTDDVAALGSLAAVAAAAFAPLLIGASPALLGLDSFAGSPVAADLADALQTAERQRWRSLQGREDTRFLGVLLPRVLARAPWPDDGTRPDRFRYREHAPDAEARVWSTPVHAFAAVAMRAFARFGWPADVRGAQLGEQAMGGVVDMLPDERFPSDPEGRPPRAPMELYLTDEQERQLSEAGLIPLVALDGLPEASFGTVPSLHRPLRMTGSAPEANQRLSAQFNAMLCVSRFAHCIKLMGRDMVGVFNNANEIEMRLQRWLDGFSNTLASDDPGLAARYPLREARVEVRERPGQPGVYGCVIHLQPHYQLDEVGAAFRLVADLAAPRAGAAA
nr:type VI secretion system contractile sheath large subunit [Roseomonas acroporae]